MTLRIEGDAVAPAEPALLSRALTNLLDNARRYGQPGGVVTVAIAGGGNKVRIVVRNRSLPIGREELGRIFDYFYRSDPSRVRTAERHGLGLAIVKAVALMHQGEVIADHAAGEVIVGFAIPVTSIDRASRLPAQRSGP